MKTKIILCFVFCMLCTAIAIAQYQRAAAQDRMTREIAIENRIAQDKRTKIKDYLNREILIEDVWAGQSITLIKEDEDYFVLRQYHGSGVPVVGFAKYKVEFRSDWQIRFSEIIENSRPGLKKPNEEFQLGVGENGLALYLNGLRVVIQDPLLEKNEQKK